MAHSPTETGDRGNLFLEQFSEAGLQILSPGLPPPPLKKLGSHIQGIDSPFDKGAATAGDT